MRQIIFIGAVIAILISGCAQEVPEKPPGEPPISETGNFSSFKSAEEVKEYLQSVDFSGTGYWGFDIGVGRAMGEIAVEEAAIEVTDSLGAPAEVPKALPSEPSRVSETTVQVVGIDEPDIVKTDGKNIYYSKKWYRFYSVVWGGDEKYPSYKPETAVIKAFPPEELEIEDEIDKSGELLLSNDMLVIFSYDRIYGYDVSGKPEKVWSIDLNGSIVTSRLYNDKIYLVTRNYIDYYEPCPIRPLTVNSEPFVISCQRIFHPVQPVPVDVTYNVMVLNPETGEVEDAVSFMGSSGSSVVYMSKNAIYITYSQYADIVKFTYNFLLENTDLFPAEVIEKVKKLLDYDISNRAKQVELQIILDQYTASLDRDEMLKFRNEMNNRMNDYREEHKRDLERTGIAKIDLELNLKASGEVPGRVLNQFSLDEYNGYLRIATTVGRWSEATNDLYVLDEDLSAVGSIKDFGKEERIYAVRFIGDKGYIVTFREIDPFFVMDLSDPENPAIKGELKIPGYSSYLHPITTDLILGIGKEDQNVKISLFDVSDAEKPEEIDKYELDEYWSDVLNTHHAFLLDSKHEIFFLPGGKGGYIFSYKNGELRLEKAVSTSALRAIYIEDYLYIIGNEVVVFDENTWEKVNELDLNT
jgi:uncharacterized secreted protein with C-terminal beta-propeller domain